MAGGTVSSLRLCLRGGIVEASDALEPDVTAGVDGAMGDGGTVGGWAGSRNSPRKRSQSDGFALIQWIRMKPAAMVLQFPLVSLRSIFCR